VLVVKIAAGALQAQIMQEFMPSSRVDPRVERVAGVFSDQPGSEGKKINREELNRAVEKLNKAAEMYNQMLQFSLTGANENPAVAMADKNTGVILRNLSPQEAVELAGKASLPPGVALDSYL
jgi:uncharacterized FlaG/YvyC family protein